MKSDNSVADTKLFNIAGLLLFMVWLLATFYVIMLMGVVLFSPIVIDEAVNLSQKLAIGSNNGTVLSLTMLLTFFTLPLAIFLVIKWRLANIDKTTQNSQSNSTLLFVAENQNSKRSVANYIALKPFKVSVGVTMLVVWLIYMVASEFITYWRGNDPTDFVDVLYDSAQPKWVLVFAMVVAVPVYEEIMFRGAMWSALREQIKGQAGVWFACILTSIVFTVIHLQYDWIELSVLFVLALIMSYARYKSGSLWLPIIIHILNNAVAMTQYILFIR